MKILVTGGAGFIGSAVVRQYLTQTEHQVLVLDKLTYAANLSSLASVAHLPSYGLVRVDVADAAGVARALTEYQPDAVMHLAAESHVDRSIDGPSAFIQTNVVGSFTLLEQCLRYWRALPEPRKSRFRFHHVSTDEVFGSLGPTGAFHETTAYDPRSPYSASKAASDHLVRAWYHTYGLPVVLTNCSNNYGPYHFPEKLIPLMILKGLKREPLPVYGRGTNVRDWLYVDDHARALRLVLERGRLGESYNIGGDAERQNLEVVHGVCDLLDELEPGAEPRRGLVQFVADRPGHDARYAMNFDKLRGELGWQPSESFESGLRKTVEWYLSHRQWWQDILSGNYQLERLGQGAP